MQLLSRSVDFIKSNLDALMRDKSELLTTDRWQAKDLKLQMVELLHVNFALDISEYHTIEAVQEDIPANLPWAENHFRERICGAPLNPGVEWANWPWANTADSSREPNGQFNHNYMERFWPKLWSSLPTTTVLSHTDVLMENDDIKPQRGMRHEYGDLGDVITTLSSDKGTRQAYLPVWFPEDTNSENKGRKPCTLGYHFIVRDNRLDITYHIRSCDYYRHFWDDVYLAIRLASHVLSDCQAINPLEFKQVTLGDLRMNITSLHMFLPDYQLKFKQQHPAY